MLEPHRYGSGAVGRPIAIDLMVIVVEILVLAALGMRRRALRRELARPIKAEEGRVP